MLPLEDLIRSLLRFILKICIMFLKMFALWVCLSLLVSVLGSFHLCLCSSRGVGSSLLVQLTIVINFRPHSFGMAPVLCLGSFYFRGPFVVCYFCISIIVFYFDICYF